MHSFRGIIQHAKSLPARWSQLKKVRPTDARSMSAFVAVATLFATLVAAIGGEWLVFSQYYYYGAYGPVQGLQNCAVTFSNQFTAEQSNVTVAFRTSGAVPAEGTITVDFPTGFTVPAQMTVTGTSGFTGTQPTAATGASNRAHIFFGNNTSISANTNVSFTLQSVINTSTAGTTAGFPIITWDNNDMQVDSCEAAGRTFGNRTGSGGGGGGGGGGGTQPPTGGTPGPSPTSSPSPSASPGTVFEREQIIGPSGGTIDLGGGPTVDGGIGVSFPAGTFPDTVKVIVRYTVAPANISAPSGTRLLNITIEIVASTAEQVSGVDHQLMQEGTQQPQEPAAIRANLSLAQLGGANINSVRGGLIDEQTGTVTALPTRVVDPGQGIVEVTTYHLSKFTLFAITRPGPSVVQPAHEAKLTTMGPTLTWTNPAGTVNWYEIRVTPFNNDGPAIHLLIGDPAMVQAQRYEIQEPQMGAQIGHYVMLPDMTYLWSVRTSSSPGQPVEGEWSAWSDARVFETPSRGGSGVIRLSPDEGALVTTRRPVINWANSDTDVFYYEVQISSDRNFGSASGSPALWWELVHGGQSDPFNSYAVPDQFPLAPNTTYHWRVRPRVQGDGEPAGWSQAFTFVTPPR